MNILGSSAVTDEWDAGFEKVSGDFEGASSLSAVERFAGKFGAIDNLNRAEVWARRNCGAGSGSFYTMLFC